MNKFFKKNRFFNWIYKLQKIYKHSFPNKHFAQFGEDILISTIFRDIKNFQKFKDKIIFIKVTDMPDGIDPYLRENHQRNCILRGLSDAKSNDKIIISDLDEIPNPLKISEFKKNMKYAVFKQNHFYYKFNLQSENNPFWYGSRICNFKDLKSPQWLRNLKFKKRPFWRLDKFRLNNIIDDGGWHFCNLKSPEN